MADAAQPRFLDKKNVIIPPLPGIGLTEITEIEIGDRTDHFSQHGAEVRRQFTVKPFRAFPDFVGAMEGGWEKDAAGKYARLVPHIDPYTECVWTDSIVNPMESDGVAASPSLNWQTQRRALIAPDAAPGEEPPELVQDNQTLRQRLVNLDHLRGSERLEQFYPGAIITGIYRPIISASTSTKPKLEDRMRHAMDYLDPTFTAGSFTIPWTDGLRYSVGNFNKRIYIKVPKGIVAPITIPTVEITIRRTLVPNLREATRWNELVGKVNQDDWHPTETDLPTFPAETLRFDGWEPTLKLTRQVIGDGVGKTRIQTYWDIKLKFTWLDCYDTPVQLTDGTWKVEGAPVTWNHALMRPTTTIPGFGAVPGVQLFNEEDLGWYRPFRTSASKVFGALPPIDNIGDLAPAAVFGQLGIAIALAGAFGGDKQGWMYPTCTNRALQDLFKLNPIGP